MERREFTRAGMSALAAMVVTRGKGWRAASSPWLPREMLLAEIPTLMELAIVPGLAFAVVDGTRVSTYVFGQSRRELLQDVAPTTEFEAASLGKPVFAAAALRLLDAHVLELDRPLSSYASLPDIVDPAAR